MTERLKRLGIWLLVQPLAAWIVAGVFFLATLFFSLRLTFLHDEGVFTYDMARTALSGPLAVFFLLKAKPLLVLLYAPAAALGLYAFFALHALLAAATIVLVSAAARRMRAAFPNLAGWAMATSLGYSVAAASGFSNSDGAFWLALFLFLYVSEHRLAAALLLGSLALARHELALFSLLALWWDYHQRQSVRFVLQFLSLPLAYLILGAIYHGDILWLVHMSPDAQLKPEAIMGYPPPSLLPIAENWRDSLLVNFGPIGLFAFLRWPGEDGWRRFLLLAVLIGYGLMTLFQAVGAFGFDLSLRYHLAGMPLVALLAAAEANRFGAAAWTALAAISLFLITSQYGSFLLPLMAVAALALAWWRSQVIKVWATALMAAATLAQLVMGMCGGEFGRQQHIENHQLVEALKRSGVFQGQPIYSDRYTLRYDRCAALGEVFLLANAAIQWEAKNMVDFGSQQWRAIDRALAREKFLLDPETHRVDTKAVYLFEEGERMASWRARIQSQKPSSLRLGRYELFFWPSP